MGTLQNNLQPGYLEQLLEKVFFIFNPTGTSLAAEFWQVGIRTGFSPVCGNKFKDGICKIAKDVVKPCDGCPSQDYKPLNAAMFKEHINGKKRFGIYPLGQDGLTAWVAADFDNHEGKADPKSDVQKMFHVAHAWEIPLQVFNSNSGKGYHPYLFFDKPIPAQKARLLMHTLIEGAGVKHISQNGSFDAVFPKQDMLSPGDLGNLIALPFNGEAAEKRNTTLLLDNRNDLKPYGEPLEDNLECFLENLVTIEEAAVDRLLKALGVEGTEGPEGKSFHGKGNANERLNSLIESCGFLRHCRDDAITLTEPEWYLMTCLLASQYGGPNQIHELSLSHPGYSQKETDEKIAHALNDCPGPPTCETIKKVWDCGRICEVDTPISLLRQDTKIRVSEESDELPKDEKLIPLYPFDFDAFPPSLADFINDTSESLQVEREVIASNALTILSGTIGNTIRVSPKEGYEVPPFLWLMVIAPTGYGKSPAIDKLINPLARKQSVAYTEYKKAFAEYEDKIRKARKDKKAPWPKEGERPALRHYIVSDTTTEALANVFYDDSRGTLIHLDELSGLILGLNQYKAKGRGSDRQKYLELFDARSWKIDRKTGVLFIPNTGAAIIGGIQTQIMPKVFSSDSLYDGLLPRFIMVNAKDKPQKFSRKSLTEDDLAPWKKLLNGCYHIPLVCSNDGFVKPENIILNEEAVDIWSAFHDEFYNIGQFLSNECRGFIPKLITYSLKFAGILHQISRLSENKRSDTSISIETTQHAIKITRFFAGQASNVLRLYRGGNESHNEYHNRLIQTLWDLRGEVVNGKLHLEKIRTVFNDGLLETIQLTHNKQVGTMLRKMGLIVDRATGGPACLIFEMEKIKKLFLEKSSLSSLNQSDDPKW